MECSSAAVTVAAATAMLVAAAVASAAGFDGVRGWGPLELGSGLRQATAALDRAGISYRVKPVPKDGTTRILLAGEGGEGVCTFGDSGRLTQIAFTGPVTKSRDQAVAAEGRLIGRYGPAHEIVSLTSSDGLREDRSLVWRNAAVQLTVTVAHMIPEGEWVVFETYRPAAAAAAGKRKEAEVAELQGRERWEVRIEEGPPHGGLYELEQETFFHIVDRRSGAVVKTFTGSYKASFTGQGTWGDGSSTGVSQVVIDDQGRWVFGLHADRMVESFALGDEPVPADPALPWRLAGHPLPSLPMTVDGVRFDEGSDVETLVARLASGWLPAEVASRHRGFPVAWLSELYLRLNGLPLSSALAAAIARGLTGEDEARRGLALGFYRFVPYAEGIGRVLEAVGARGPAEAVRASRTRLGEGEVSYAPIDVFAAFVDTGRLDAFGLTVLQACADALLVPTERCEDSHLEAIVGHDPGWLARNAPAVVRACPARLERVFFHLYVAGRSDLETSAAIALGQDPGIDRGAFEAWLATAKHLDQQAIRRAVGSS